MAPAIPSPTMMAKLDALAGGWPMPESPRTMLPGMLVGDAGLPSPSPAAPPPQPPTSPVAPPAAPPPSTSPVAPAAAPPVVSAAAAALPPTRPMGAAVTPLPAAAPVPPAAPPPAVAAPALAAPPTKVVNAAATPPAELLASASAAAAAPAAAASPAADAEQPRSTSKPTRAIGADRSPAAGRRGGIGGLIDAVAYSWRFVIHGVQGQVELATLRKEMTVRHATRDAALATLGAAVEQHRPDLDAIEPLAAGLGETRAQSEAMAARSADITAEIERLEREYLSDERVTQSQLQDLQVRITGLDEKLRPLLEERRGLTHRQADAERDERALAQKIDGAKGRLEKLRAQAGDPGEMAQLEVQLKLDAERVEEVVRSRPAIDARKAALDPEVQTLEVELEVHRNTQVERQHTLQQRLAAKDLRVRELKGQLSAGAREAAQLKERRAGLHRDAGLRVLAAPDAGPAVESVAAAELERARQAARSVSDLEEEIERVRRGLAEVDRSALLRGGAVAGGGLLVVLGVVLAIQLSRGTPPAGDLNFRVERQASRGVQKVDIEPRALRAGTLRFAGEARQVPAGPSPAQSFEVPEARLKVGDNPLEALLEAPGTRPVRRQVTLEVPFALQPDYSQIQKGMLVLRVATAADAQLAINGTAQKSQAPGVFVAQLPVSELIKPAPGDIMSQPVTLTVKVTRGARQVEERRQLLLPLPVPELDIETPLPGAEVDTGRIVVSGRTRPGTRVLLNGTLVKVDDQGRFRALHQLAGGDNTLKVIARLPGMGSNVVLLPVHRKLAPRQAAAEWAKKIEAPLKYNVLQKNPLRHKSAKVVFHGKIVSIQERAGTNTVDINTCLRGRACPLRVTFQGDTDLVNGDWADVYGEVEGEHQTTTPTGGALSVPSVLAKYLLKAAPPAEPK
jgi:hypothetical protein